MTSTPAAPAGSDAPLGGRGALVLALAGLTLAGSLLAALPHLVDLGRGDPPTYLADTDQLLYMGWSRAVVLEGAGHLVDAVDPRPGPMMHPWALFVPVAWVAHAIGLGPMGLTVLWRLLGGAGIALGLYVALRPVAGRRSVALALAVILLFDAGLLLGQPLVRSLLVARDLARGSGAFFGGPPQVMAHLRVVPPALVLPFLLVAIGLTTHARITLSARWAIAAGVALGALFHVYLYFWTVVLGGLLLGGLLDPKGRRTFATVIVVGCLLGAPAVIVGAQVKAATSPDWLHRTEKFVPIGRFEGLLLPKMLIALWLVSACLVFGRRRELTWLWCMVGAGLACANHQVVSGLQIENFHWLLATGIAFSVLISALVAPALTRFASWRLGLLGLAALVASQVALGTYLRTEEVFRTRETRRLRTVFAGLRRDRADAVPRGATIAGDPDAVMILAALGEVYPVAGRFPEFAARVTDAQFDERLMLNLYLIGLDRAAAHDAAEAPPGTLSWESLAVHSPTVAARQRARRLALAEQIWSNPDPFLVRYRVTHVVLPADAPDPLSTGDHVSTARPIVRGPSWQLWAIDAARPASPVTR